MSKFKEIIGKIEYGYIYLVWCVWVLQVRVFEIFYTIGDYFLKKISRSLYRKRMKYKKFGLSFYKWGIAYRYAHKFVVAAVVILIAFVLILLDRLINCLLKLELNLILIYIYF